MYYSRVFLRKRRGEKSPMEWGEKLWKIKLYSLLKIAHGSADTLNNYDT